MFSYLLVLPFVFIFIVIFIFLAVGLGIIVTYNRCIIYLIGGALFIRVIALGLFVGIY